MDPRILIATFLLPLGLWAAADSALPPPPGPSTDSVKTAARVREPVLRDDTPVLAIPVRDGAAGGALREAFRAGDASVPWSRVFEFDGMYEEWMAWPSLPTPVRAERLSWAGPSLAGVSDAAPLQVVALARESGMGWGGQATRQMLAAAPPADTPSTRLQFFRGALASYRFGLDFSRALAGPWGLELRMGTRSAQGRSWTYRDQIQDMFQGSFGRTREDLPARGRSPGQDDVQWETVVSRASSNLLLELGWTWVDLRRGIPDPRNAWGDSGSVALPGQEARSGVFGRLRARDGDWTVSLSGRLVGQDWKRARWERSDSGALASASGSVDHQEIEGELSWGGPRFRLGAAGRGALRTGTAGSVAGTFQEDQERVGAFLESRGGAFQTRLEAGFDRLNDPLNHTFSDFDAAVSLGWTGAVWQSRNRMARELALPDWERSILPDPLLRSLPSRNLRTETRWVAESRQTWKVGRFLSFEAGLAGLGLDDAIQPAAVPTEGVVTDSVRSGLVLVNAAGRVLGASASAGARFDGGGWWIGSQGALGRTLAPGEGLGGRRDLRFPLLHTRTTLGWEGPVLAGRAKLLSSMSLRTWSAATELAGATAGATDVRLPPGGQLDWETLFQIKTFALFWRLENLLDDRQTPAAGWTPPGIRSGWGVTWSFGG